jgi:pantetheine-phosphate adenylyltransferase
MKTLAVYPGTFDPITNGHLDIIKRALKLFDTIIVAVADNPSKEPFFTLEDRIYMVEKSLEEAGLGHKVTVDSFEGLLVDYARDKGAHVIVRGLRAVSDFEYEFQMALMNRKLCREVEIHFLMTSLRWIFISSKIIKEVVFAGGDLTGLVPEVVIEKFGEVMKKRG